MLTPQDMAIAEARVSGKSLQEIATPANVHESTISRRLAKTEVREYIEHLHQDLIASSLGKAVGNIYHAINSYVTGATIKAITKDGKEIDLTDTQLREHGFKASLKLAESVGILPAQAQTILINNIYNDNRTEMPESIKQLFAAVTHKDAGNQSLLDDGQVIDVDPVK